MEAILKQVADGCLPVTIAAVISNRDDAAGLETARKHGVPTAVLNHRNYVSREAFDEAMAQLIDGFSADLVVLAGFMRILSEGFTRHYQGRLINIHPSLLPAFTGLHTHERALAEGVRVHGCTVHFVTPELDHGPIILQAAVPVLDGDDVETLAARVLEQEHKIYPEAIRRFALGWLTIDGLSVRSLNSPASCHNALISPVISTAQ